MWRLIFLFFSLRLVACDGGSATTAAGFNVLHNIFYGNTTINFSITNQAGSAIIKNNLFHSSSAMTHIYVNGTLSGASVDYNCYQDQTNMFGYNSSAYSTLSGFNGVTGFETNGTGSGTIGLANPASGDFTITAGSSSCDGLGDASVGISADYAGNSYANPPASGAYEAQ